MEKFTLFFFFSINSRGCLDKETERVLDRAAVAADSHIIYLISEAIY